ncbi:MAG: hypothetical protein ACRYGP_31195 [Janthinobacterium lividum]
MNVGTGVFVLQNESTLVAMQAASFASEDHFQRLLASFPELLAGDQIDAEVPRRFMLVAREQGIASEEGAGGRWSIDHLFLDQDGVPTLVEVKRGTDTRIRREVVGQMLDYAANAVLHWPVDALRARFAERCASEGNEPSDVLSRLIGVEQDGDVFWEQVRANLSAGRIRLLFVADRIPSELRRIVEFLNRQMRPAEVLAIELRQYEGQGLKTLVPIVLGQTQEAIQKKSSTSRPALPKRAWDATALMTEIIEKADETAVAASRAIVDWIGRRADRTTYNSNPVWGWMGAVFEKDGAEIPLLRVHSDGSVAVYFEYMLHKPVFGDIARRQDLLDRLNAVPGVRLPPDAVSKRKTIALKGFTPAATSQFLAAMDWFVTELRHGGGAAQTSENDTPAA